VFVVALILLIVVVLVVIAALFGGGDATTIDLGSANLDLSAGQVFFFGMGTLLVLVVSLGLFRAGARRASARRADRKKVSELSQRLDDYKRDERENGEDERAEA
jgi:hypothetical protein